MLDNVSIRDGNGLLALLPAAALEPMLPHFSVVPLAVGIPLGEEIYFLLSGLVSTFVLMSAGQVVYTGIVGREGAVGLTGVGSWSPVQTAMLVAGTAAKDSSFTFSCRLQREFCDSGTANAVQRADDQLRPTRSIMHVAAASP
jgi:hypothetical protein